MDKVAIPAPGTVYTFRLQNGQHGACRVLRPAGEDEAQFAGHSLVYGSQWVGEPAAALKHPGTKKIIKSLHGLALYWVKGGAPASFTEAGVVAVTKAEQGKRCKLSAPWDIFPNVVFQGWEKANDPEKLKARIRSNIEEGERIQKAQVEELAGRERIDLTGVVGLPKPREERTPEEVVRGFVAAMHRWESECGRIAKAQKPGAADAVFGISGPPMQAIFDEFCTPRERPYGRRGGGYSDRPEYDPRDTMGEGKTLGPRRVEIETSRGGPVPERVKYVLLKVGGMWLVDNKTRNGLKATL